MSESIVKRLDMRSLKAALSVALLALPAEVPMAQDWGKFAIISSTLGTKANRLCIGEGLREGDIGCPSYAPSLTTAGDVLVTANLSAAKFFGDGSGLTGVTAAPADRIVSGTAHVVAHENSGISASAPMDVSGSVRVSGTMKVAGTGVEGCGPSTYGTMRRNPTTGAMQVCVER
jgi:hypothetical protein